MHHLNDYGDILKLLAEGLRMGTGLIIFEPAQSNTIILRLLKSPYWKIADGGKYCFIYSEWLNIFQSTEVVWDIISAPLNQIYMAEIR